MEEEKSKQKILFFYRCHNQVYIVKEEGFFVTSEGNIYSINFQGDGDYPFNKEYLDILNKMMNDPNIKPCRKCDKEEIIKAHEIASKIDKNIKMRSIYTGCGFGTSEFCAVFENHLIVLAIIGDSSGIIESDEAQEIFKILKKNDIFEWSIGDRNLSYDNYYVQNYTFPIYEKI